MTVKDLITLLGEFDPNLNIVVRGYEDGFDDVTGASIVTLRLAANPEEYYGRHSKSEDTTGKAALLLKSNRRY
jgi:hypothetical protein